MAPKAVTPNRPEPAAEPVTDTLPTRALTEDTKKLHWTVHPARQAPAKAVAATGVVLLLAAGVGIETQSLAWAAFAALVLYGSLNRFYLPTHFELDDQAIEIRYPLRSVKLEWTQVRRFAADRRGGVLYRSHRPSVRDRWTSSPIAFPPNDEAPYETVQELLASRKTRCVG